jgi:signal peptidase I
MASWIRNNRGLLVFLLCLGIFRTAVADWNPIPSGSMRPTLLEGDVVLVDRLAYDVKLPLTDRSLARLADPQRGDVVTFSSPVTGTRLIKRIVAVPGDVVQVRDGVLSVNGQAAVYSEQEAVVDMLVPGVAGGCSTSTGPAKPASSAPCDFRPTATSCWATTATTAKIHATSAWCPGP